MTEGRPRILTRRDLEAGVQALLLLDDRFEPVAQVTGVPQLRRRPSGFEGLAWIITGQMISLHAAASIWERTRAALGQVDAERVLGVDERSLLDAGQSRAKVRTLREAADAVADGRLDFDALAELDDDEVAEVLMRIRGIGAWTSSMYLLACEGRTDAWPVGDVAIQAATGDVLGLGRRTSPEELEALGSGWRPWRAVAARLLWDYYLARVVTRGRKAPGRQAS